MAHLINRGERPADARDRAWPNLKDTSKRITVVGRECQGRPDLKSSSKQAVVASGKKRRD